MTIIELMITMVILGIITSVALPAMRDIMTHKNTETIGPLFERSVKLARVEAIQRSVNVRIKPTSNTSDWSQGWFIEFTDSANNTQLIKRFDALPGNVVFTSDTFNAGTDLVIEATGQIVTPGNFTLFYPGCIGDDVYGFQLLLSGSVLKGVTACP